MWTITQRHVDFSVVLYIVCVHALHAFIPPSLWTDNFLFLSPLSFFFLSLSLLSVFLLSFYFLSPFLISLLIPLFSLLFLSSSSLRPLSSLSLFFSLLSLPLLSSSFSLFSLSSFSHCLSVSFFSSSFSLFLCLSFRLTLFSLSSLSSFSLPLFLFFLLSLSLSLSISISFCLSSLPLLSLSLSLYTHCYMHTLYASLSRCQSQIELLWIIFPLVAATSRHVTWLQYGSTTPSGSNSIWRAPRYAAWGKVKHVYSPPISSTCVMSLAARMRVNTQDVRHKRS